MLRASTGQVSFGLWSCPYLNLRHLDRRSQTFYIHSEVSRLHLVWTPHCDILDPILESSPVFCHRVGLQKAASLNERNNQPAHSNNQTNPFINRNMSIAALSRTSFSALKASSVVAPRAMQIVGRRGYIYLPHVEPHHDTHVRIPCLYKIDYNNCFGSSMCHSTI